MTKFAPMPNNPSLDVLSSTLDVPVDGKVVVIDTETTGLDDEKDEVLSLAIVDLDGNELFYSLIRPTSRKRWPSAQEIHGITWSDVKDKPTIYDIADDVMDILDNADYIIGYNIDFDVRMLEASGLSCIKGNTYDLMYHYSQCYGHWSDRKCDYLYVKLTKVAAKYRYKYEAHNALEDAKATAHCFKRFREACESELPLAKARYEDELARHEAFEKDMETYERAKSEEEYLRKKLTSLRSKQYNLEQWLSSSDSKIMCAVLLSAICLAIAIFTLAMQVMFLLAISSFVFITSLVWLCSSISKKSRVTKESTSLLDDIKKVEEELDKAERTKRHALLGI